MTLDDILEEVNKAESIVILTMRNKNDYKRIRSII